MLPDHLARKFPKLKADGGDKTSEAAIQYNCLSWSAKRTKQYRFEPKPQEAWERWPEGLPDDYSLESFIMLFEQLGYKRLADIDSRFEFFYKKVAIYAAFGIYGEPRWEFTHVADQLHSGVWISKLGYEEDIQHNTPQSLEGNCGDEYGKILKILKKPCWPWELAVRVYFKLVSFLRKSFKVI